MRAHLLLKKAADQGIALVVVDGRVKGSGVKPGPAFLAQLKENEAEIVTLLRGQAEIDERKARYRAALLQFKAQRGYSAARWDHDRACYSAEMFIREWESLAAELGWTSGDIFDASGLAWWLQIEIVRAAGAEHAVTEQGRVYDRVTRQTWANPYSKETSMTMA